ncbi:hypothetical protein PG993_013536 [Apiospora rasikravindrae]|uniref:Uncharacterized protein n=1 Tax=Apiospora rasikravindrae TaxID=990691 RepID=A0ABR1RXX3_9PEZI
MATATTADPTTSTARGAGPLTTVFTMPDFCQPPWWTFSGTPAVSSSVCMPGNWGYTEGCYLPESAARVSADGSPWNGGPILAGETARICCPEGYSCFEDTSTDSAVQWRKCITTAADPTTTYVHTQDGTVTYNTTTLGLAFGIQVRWQSSDLSILETDPTVPGATYTGRTSDNPDNGDKGDGGAPHDGHSTGRDRAGGRTGTEDNPNDSSSSNNDNNNNNASITALSANSAGFAGVPTHDEEEEMKSSLATLPMPTEMDAAVIHEADSDAHPWMELPASHGPAIQEMPATTFVAELADTSVAPYRRADEISIATSHDIEGWSARRKSLRDGGGSLHARKWSWAS